jgi:hypothetical protein
MTSNITDNSQVLLMTSPIKGKVGACVRYNELNDFVYLDAYNSALLKVEIINHSKTFEQKREIGIQRFVILKQLSKDLIVTAQTDESEYIVTGKRP